MKYIQLNVDDQGLATLVLNRPEVLNVLNAPLIEEVSAALEQLAGDDRTRVLIITGSGRGFCAGADLSAIQREAQIRAATATGYRCGPGGQLALAENGRTRSSTGNPANGR